MTQYNTLGIGRITKVVADANGVAAKRVAVYGDAENTVENPAGANAGRLAGVTYGGAEDGGAVALAEYGYPEIEAAGPIAYGVEVNVADAVGRIKAINEGAGTLVTLVGVTEEAAAATGDRIKVNVKRFGQTKTV